MKINLTKMELFADNLEKICVSLENEMQLLKKELNRLSANTETEELEVQIAKTLKSSEEYCCELRRMKAAAKRIAQVYIMAEAYIEDVSESNKKIARILYRSSVLLKTQSSVRIM